MSNDGELAHAVMTLSMEDRQLLAGLDDTTRKIAQKLEHTEKTAQDHANKTANTVGRVSLAYTEVASKVNLLKDVWSTATSILSAPIEAAKEETARNVELVAALKVRGEATKENIAALNALAGAQSFATATDDEAIVKIQSIGLNVGKVALEDMPAYIKAVQGYAEFSGRSFESAAQIVSKFTSGATPRIRGLALEIDETASVHDKLNALLPLTAGAYQALLDKSNTFEGAQRKVNTAWQNTLEALGNMLTTSPAVIEALQKMAEWIQSGAEWLQKHPDAIAKAGEAVQKWFAADGPVQTVLKDTAYVIEGIAKAFRGIAGLVNDPHTTLMGTPAEMMTGGGQPGQYRDANGDWRNYPAGTVINPNGGSSYTYDRPVSSVNRNTSRAPSPGDAETNSLLRGILNALGGKGASGVYILNAAEIARHLSNAGSMQLAEAQYGGG